MNISEIVIRRPVFGIVMNIFLIIFGVIGYRTLPVRQYPNIDPPVITVKTSYTGANPEIIEEQVTVPLEKNLNSCPGIRTMASRSSSGSSVIFVEFQVGYNLETAANDVRDKVAQSIGYLPANLDAPPTVTKSDANSDYVVLMGISSKSKTLVQLSDYTERYLLGVFQTILGVTEVDVVGEKQPSMTLLLDPNRMNSFNITYSDITNAVARENVELPAGKIYGRNTELLLRPDGYLRSSEEFNNIIIREDSNGIVRFRDVGRAEESPYTFEQIFTVNGRRLIGLGVLPLAGANVISIANEFYKRLDKIKKTSGDEYQFTTIVDNTQIIRQGISEVKETLLISFILVVLIIYLFFRNWLVALRPLLDIPVSLIFTFFVMYIMGYSINILTLLGIVMATGLVVDDGIVVTENIFRKVEKGMHIRQAAIDGSKEIFFAVISTSLTLAVVFLPILFLSGFVGALFKEFAVVVASAVLVSAFVSLTLTPILNVYLTQENAGHGKFYLATEKYFLALESGYHKFLHFFLSKIRWVAWVIFILCIVLCVFLKGYIHSEVAPIEDKSRCRFQIEAEEGTSYTDMVKYVTQFTDWMYDSIPERNQVYLSVPSYGGTTGNVNYANARIDFIPVPDRSRSQSEIVADLMKHVGQFKNLLILAAQEQTISVGSSTTALPCRIVLENFDIAKLKKFVPIFVEKCRESPVFQSVTVDFKFTKPDIRFTVDRTKCYDLGLSLQDVQFVIEQSFAGKFIGYYYPSGFQYRIVPLVQYADRQTPYDLRKLFVKNNKGNLIELSQVLITKEYTDPPTYYHFNRYEAGIVSASINPGYTLGDGVKVMKDVADKYLDESFTTQWWGAARDFADSSSLTFVFCLALLLIYLVLAAQFESFIDPFVIMFTVPLAVAGALISLYFTNQTLNLFSEIGIIMLIGLVTKNGILIVEFANQKNENGETKFDAVVESATQRLRPILMTTLAMVLGAVPIALSLGAASTSRVGLGVVIIGGLLFSLILTLFVIPAMYLYMTRAPRNNDDGNTPDMVD